MWPYNPFTLSLKKYSKSGLMLPTINPVAEKYLDFTKGRTIAGWPGVNGIVRSNSDPVYSTTSATFLLLKNIIPMIKQTAATIIGYHSPAKGSPAGFDVDLLLSYREVAINGVKPPKTPLPI